MSSRWGIDGDGHVGALLVVGAVVAAAIDPDRVAGDRPRPDGGGRHADDRASLVAEVHHRCKPTGSAPDSLQNEARGTLEDAVIRDERYAKAQCRGGDPSVGVVLALAKGVSGALAGYTELDVDADELVSGVDDLGPGDLCFETAQAGVAPTTAQRAEAKLGDGLERQEGRAAHQEGVVAAGQRRIGSEQRAEDVGVDDDGSPVRCRQLRTAARNASASSGVRSSITISP